MEITIDQIPADDYSEVTIFHNRMKKIGINLTYICGSVGNLGERLLYIYKVNGIKVYKDEDSYKIALAIKYFSANKKCHAFSIFKGGKSISFLFNKIRDTIKYESYITIVQE